MNASETVISVREVSKSFKEVKAVQSVSLDIQRGEYVALLGPNGAGKTTLVEMIEGIQQPDAGTISILGKNWKEHSEELHQNIGLSLQETRFIDKLSVMETMRLFASFYGLDQQRIDAVLELVRLTEKKKAYMVNLSGGQRQRIALGIALLNNPKVLLLDEPTTGLDPNARREIWDILFHLKQKYQTTMILTTHYMEEADYLCDRIVIMDSGQMLGRGTKEELLAQYKSGEVIEFAFSKDIVPTQLSGLGQEIEWEEEYRKGKLVVKDIVTDLPVFLARVEQEGWILSSLECRKMTLDDLFVSMTGRSLSE